MSPEVTLLTEAVIIIRMLPPRECSPNVRVSWRRRAKAVAEFRAEALKAAQYEATEAVSAFCGYTLPVRLNAEISWCCGRKRLDDDNAKASLKPLVDGISDWLWFGHDDHVTIGTVVQRTGGDGMVTVTLKGESVG